jgi:hypothetical protein
VRDVKRIEVLRAWREKQLGLAAFKLFQSKAEVIDKGDLGAKWDAHVRDFRISRR